MQVARLRMLGVPLDDIEDELINLDEDAKTIWKRARRKLGTTLFGGA